MLLAGFFLASCGSYRQNILFEVAPDQVAQEVREAEAHYRIQPDDLLTLEVYTNDGETLIDPNRESFGKNGPPTADLHPVEYLVDSHGVVKFPMIGAINIGTLTLGEAERRLSEEYEHYYEGAYVVLRFTNKRAIVLGAPGGRIIPLRNENMRLAEVLALAEGITRDARATNIRLIRGDKVFVSDFSTFDGYLKGNYVVKPGDIIYIEPVRRPFIEALRDYSPIITFVSSVATLIFIISQVNP